jgi:hypothetical protein
MFTSILFGLSLAVAVVLLTRVADQQGPTFLLAAMNNVKAGELSATALPTVYLAVAPFTPAPNLVLSDITQPTFGGYAAILLTAWGTSHFQPDNTPCVNASPILTWTPTSSAVSDAVAGFMAISGTGVMISNGAFDTPVLLDSIDTTLSFVYGVGIGLGTYTSTQLP